MGLVPASRRMGFAVLERPNFPIDWGVKDIRKDFEEAAVTEAIRLLDEHSPNALVMEQIGDPILKRAKKVHEVVFRIDAIATERGIPVYVFTREEVLPALLDRNNGSKDDLAAAVGEIVPEVQGRVPRRRKLWTCEDKQMPMFEAFAIAMTFEQCGDRT